MRVKTAFNALEIGHTSRLDSQFIKILRKATLFLASKVPVVRAQQRALLKKNRNVKKSVGLICKTATLHVNHTFWYMNKTTLNVHHTFQYISPSRRRHCATTT